MDPIETTTIHTYVSTRDLQKIMNPLDRILTDKPTTIRLIDNGEEKNKSLYVYLQLLPNIKKLNLRRLLFLFISTALLSCSNDLERYPPLTWNDTKLDSVLGSFGNTRGDEINDFTDKNGVYIRCLFDGTDYKKMFENQKDFGFQDSSQAFDYRNKMCDLIHETKACLIYSNETHGALTVFKYKNGTELYYIKDTSSTNLSGNEYWKKSFKNNLRKSKHLETYWYLNKNGNMFNLPD